MKFSSFGPRMTAHEVVQGLVRHAPALIRRAYLRSGWALDLPSCTAMAWIASDALRRFDVVSEPIDMAVSVWNHHFAIFQQSGIDHPDAYRHSNDPVVLAVSGYRDMTTLTHLVVHVPAASAIVDLTCWQLSRPSRGIELPDAIALPWDGQQAQHETPAGSVLQYRPWPVEYVRSMESRVDWAFGAHSFGPLSKVIARRIRERPVHHRPAGLQQPRS